MIEAAKSLEEPKHFEVFPENKEVVELFLIVQTQWRTSFGGFVGLDYTAVFQTMRICGIKFNRDGIVDLQIMELAALSVVNSKAGGWSWA